ncbi:unnamed protein product [Rotaria magnacalcarata]|uniref:Uncharacterized protein n=1 Tax=Rotaria magnacalcarata TaxID=392030 RepID=A0A815ZGI5_9BILA|nr:unnamed protein product [Rotaria magnacalcarata]CAF1584803.1 unnamed protein product [Rotaria magnacalcarata]CAF2150347.1 unnamed protein product [Rotaria magnacalcarata]CAF2235925.1 unnamed protein product [Rotaria magnacalcarata]CAF3805787.1 unnamed protein product [Rotaria magnacalcarata]
MHLTGVFILLLLSVGTVSSLVSGGPWTIFEIPVCDYFAKHPDLATPALANANQTLHKFDNTPRAFNSALAYINAPGNWQKLINGKTQCSEFMDGLGEALKADFQQQPRTGKPIANQIMEEFQQLFAGMF